MHDPKQLLAHRITLVVTTVLGGLSLWWYVREDGGIEAIIVGLGCLLTLTLGIFFRQRNPEGIPSEKNVVRDSRITAQRTHIGDVEADGSVTNTKNVVERSQVRTQGDFRVGDG